MHWTENHLIFMRHGPTTARPGTLLGHTDLELRGWPDAPEWQPPESVAGVWSSDLKRARQTASRYFDAVKVQTSSQLRELNFGQWDGRTWQDVESEDPKGWRRWSQNWQVARPPEGETLQEVQRRLESFAEANLQKPGCHVIFAHKGVLQLYAARILKDRLTDVFAFPLDYGAILEFDAGQLKRWDGREI